ncbi:HRDC domain-containing protein, partial [Chloroflexota bacterium]
LAGSRAAWLDAFTEHSYYGQLSHLSQRAVINIIDALITDGKLMTTSGQRPKVILPDQSLQPAETTPPVELKKVEDSRPDEEIPPTLANEVTAPDSPAPAAEPNPALFDALRTWRTQQAKEQSVPPYIVFSNKVLEAIAARCPTTLDELSQISGIGPAKLAQYGEAVLAIIAEVEGTESQSSQTIEQGEPRPQTGGGGGLSLAVPPSADREFQPPAEPDSPEQIVTLGPDEPSAANPLAAILAVVSDLDGLLTAHGLALLLTAAPADVVPFSDHELFATFHGVLTVEEMEVNIQAAIEAGQLSLSPHQRLILVEAG